MIPTIPLLNAQQQGIASLVYNVATRADVATQVAQHTVGVLIKEESKKLEEVESSPLTNTVHEDESGSQEFTAQQEQRQKREPEENVETAPSSHNPFAGKLFDTRV